MKTLYQKTLEEFTGTQELKEGDYVVCPMYPNEAIKVEKNTYGNKIYPLMVNIAGGDCYTMTVNGRHISRHDFPLFLKCPPPKKKAEKVYDVYIFNDHLKHIEDHGRSVSISTGKCDLYNTKAKLIVEVEE